MKKKVLALVVLAAMLVSVLPFAAFAAGGAAYSYYSAVKVKEDSAAADGISDDPTEDELDDSEYLEYEITLRNSDYEGTAGTLYVATARPTVDKIYVISGADKKMMDQTNGAAEIKVTATDGVAKIRIYSGVPGDTKIVFGVKDKTDISTAVANYAQDKKDSSAADANAIDQKRFSATFTSAEAQNIVVTADPYHTDRDFKAPLANGTQKYTITAKLTATNGAPISGEEVTFSVNRTGGRLSETKVTTDSYGEAEVKLYATKPDEYKVTAKVGKIDNFVDGLVFTSASVDSVKMESSENQKIALEESATFKYSFYDANGNKFKLNNTPVFDDGVIKASHELEDAEIALITAPSGVKLDLDNENHFNVTVSEDKETLKIEIKEGYLNKEGDYALKFTLANGKSVTYKFNVKEQGEITQLIFSYNADTMPAIKGATNAYDDLKLADAEGYTKKADPADVTFSINNTKLAKVHDQDDKDVNENPVSKGTIELIDDSTGTIIVTAVHNDEDLVASATVQVVNAPSTVKTTSNNVVAAGSEGEVNIQLVDVDGKNVAASFLGSAEESKVVIVSKPAGAIVDTDFDSDFNEDIRDKGASSFKITSNVEGTIGYQVVVGVKDIQTKGQTTYYTGYGEITFGKASEVITGKNIIFMIGASSYIVDGKPVPATSVPFIENGRTYLGIRDMGYAMGITGDENLNWNGTTQTATLKKGGITVEVTVGANTMKVTKNGVTTEVTLDAPAQNKDGRVYLPFRAVFQAFDYEVEYADGVITCK